MPSSISSPSGGRMNPSLPAGPLERSGCPLRSKTCSLSGGFRPAYLRYVLSLRLK